MRDSKTSFYGLEPEKIFRAIETCGLIPTGELRQLNSYENRVFELFLEKPPIEYPEIERVVVKFYRPGRWSLKCLQEEHAFLMELASEEIPVAAPLMLKSLSIFENDDLYFAVFPKIYGRMPDEILSHEVEQVGRLIAQVHSIGQKGQFRHRPDLGSNPVTGWETLEFLEKWVSVEVWGRYEAAAVTLLEMVDSEIPADSFQRIHGDFHRGNLLANKNGFLLVDFDDCVNGPIIQDFWMILQGLDDQDKVHLISGYEKLREFPDEQLEWIPLLRGLRIMNYAAWIAKRWDDPSFLKIFPEFGTYSYWAEETEALESIVRSIE